MTTFITYPDFRKGDRVRHVDHGVGTVTKVQQRDGQTVIWVRMDADGIEGTAAPQLLRELNGEG